MDFNKLTIKSGEAVAAAQELARRAGNPELTRDHLTVALLEQELPRTLLQRAGAEALVVTLPGDCVDEPFGPLEFQASRSKTFPLAEIGEFLCGDLPDVLRC